HHRVAVEPERDQRDADPEKDRVDRGERALEEDARVGAGVDEVGLVALARFQAAGGLLAAEAGSLSDRCGRRRRSAPPSVVYGLQGGTAAVAPGDVKVSGWAQSRSSRCARPPKWRLRYRSGVPSSSRSRASRKKKRSTVTTPTRPRCRPPSTSWRSQMAKR